MTTLVWINNFIRGLVIKGRSKEDPACAFILSYIDNSSFLAALRGHGLPRPYSLRSTWQPEVSWNVNQIMSLFLLKPSNGHFMSLTESPQPLPWPTRVFRSELPAHSLIPSAVTSFSPHSLCPTQTCSSQNRRKGLLLEQARGNLISL